METLQGFRLFLVNEQVGKKRKRNARTVELHLQLLTRLLKEIPDLSPAKVYDYLATLQTAGRKGSYLNDYIDTLHVYGKYLKTAIYETLSYFPEDDYEKATMSDEEIEKFLTLPCPVTTRRDSRTGKTVSYPMGLKRWRVKTMFWQCLAYTGARPGEIATLTVNDVDFGRQVFSVTGKTGQRLIPIPGHLLDPLQEYIKTLDGDFLFPSTQGGINKRQGLPVIDDTDWGYDFHQRIKRLGIKRKNLTPYSLRHSFITRMLDEDINVFKVQDIVGHKRLETARGYYHMTTKRLIKTISQDPLSRHQMTYNERFQQFRDIIRLTLETFAKDALEEQQMLKDLVKNFL